LRANYEIWGAAEKSPIRGTPNVGKTEPSVGGHAGVCAAWFCGYRA
jgi:hypothetical protein